MASSCVLELDALPEEGFETDPTQSDIIGEGEDDGDSGEGGQGGEVDLPEPPPDGVCAGNAELATNNLCVTWWSPLQPKARAAEFCNQFGRLLELETPDQAAANEAELVLLGLPSQLAPVVTTGSKGWIGGRYESGEWIWSDGSPISDILWLNQTAPSPEGGSCVTLRYEDGKLENEPCDDDPNGSRSLAFFCEG